MSFSASFSSDGIKILGVSMEETVLSRFWNDVSITIDNARVILFWLLSPGTPPNLSPDPEIYPNLSKS